MGAFVIPEDIQSLSAEELSAALSASIEASAAFADIADADLNDDQIVEMEALGNFAVAAKGELEAREAAAAERTQRAAAARANFATAPAEEEAPADDEDEEEQAGEAAAESVTAAAAKPAPRQSAAARAARKAKPAEAPEGAARASLVAAADVPGFAAGHKFSGLKDASSAIQARLNAMPEGVANFRGRYGALAMKLPQSQFNQNEMRDDEMLMAAASEARLTGGSLIAAGGWGAPSDVSLEFCELETTDGLLDLPEVTITRGGVQYTKGPSFADVLASSTGFWDMTEATAEAGSELKTALRPEVPDFTEKRLDAVGFMLEAGLLLRQGWPAVIERYAKMAYTAHAYKMANKGIAQIQAFTGAAVSVPNGFGNALDVLNILEVVANGERQRNLMAQNQTLEVLLPFWVKSVIRADLANRNGVDLINVTDATINAYFTNRLMRVQWLSAYQPITLTNGVALSYPDSVEAIMYPAGTYVRGKADVITLDTVYDSTNLKKNDYVHLFVEQGTLMTNPCGDGRRITIPLAANGRTGAADITGDLFVTPAP